MIVMRHGGFLKMSSLKIAIEQFCSKNSVDIPPGFYRHSPSQYAVVRKNDDTWQLVAKTYFNVSDMINYLDNYCEGVEYRIFDFKELVELKRRGTKQVEPSGSIDNAA